MHWFLVFLFLLVDAHAATTLKDAFTSARLNMENIRRADAVIEQKEEREKRARAAMLPTINGVGTYTRIEPPDAAGASPFLLTRQYSAAIRLSQPLLRGGTFSGYQFAKEDVLLSKFQKEVTDLNLYQLVISSYYSLMVAQNDQKNLIELQKFSSERVKELRERTSVGRSRRGELVQAEAQLLTADSQFQQGSINLQRAEKTFTFYTNLPPGELAAPTDLPKEIQPLQEMVNRVRSRPDIMATQQQVKLAESQVEISKGAHYPSLDLIGNYYLTRTGILATSDWDLGLAVVIPLFQGGGVQAAVRESVQMKNVAVLDSSQTLRIAERDLAVNYQNYVQIHEQLNTLKLALEKAEEAYKLNRRDYQYGQVTNLDVLTSLNLFIETKRSYQNLYSLAHMAHKNLEASIGVLP